MLVLTWNLFHGRALPPAGHDLLAEFSAALAGWAWDVALLQEVPPWWPAELARACGAEQRRALTSRNVLPPLQRALAVRWPDVIKSWGGGANAILVRGLGISEHRRARLRWWPEQRVVHAVRLGTGAWVGNLHAQGHPAEAARADFAQATRCVGAWAGGDPFVLGGDLNLHRPPQLPGLVHVTGHEPDHVLVSGFAAEHGDVLEHGGLSDHAPVVANIHPPSAS